MCFEKAHAAFAYHSPYRSEQGGAYAPRAI